MEEKPVGVRFQCVKKEPFLTDFPTTVLATSARRLQAIVRRTRRAISAQSFTGYAILFDDVLSPEFLNSIDPTKRQRVFGSLPLFWSWLGQILEGNASCSRGLSLLQSWCRASGIAVPSSKTASYCKARNRIRLSFLKKVHTQVLQVLCRRVRQQDCWRGLRLRAIDGSSVKLMDTPANQKIYPQHCNQKAGCGFPSMGVVGLLDLSHGGWEHIKTCHPDRHDSRAAASFVRHLGEGDLLLGDRAFCSYELIARCLTRGAHSLMRLHHVRHRRLLWEEAKKIGSCQRLVTWKRPERQPNGSSLSKKKWLELPETMTLRLIKKNFKKRDGSNGELIVVTTLTNEKTHPGAELIELYQSRWDIELKFRDWKTTLGMETFAVKSPRMAHKTLWMSVIAMNLLRTLMQQAAAEEGKSQSEMSFKGSLDLLLASHESFRQWKGQPRKIRHARKELIMTLAGKTIVLRLGRQEPRALKKRPKPYDRMTKSRQIFKEKLRGSENLMIA